jgi:hypothetical protein
MKLCITVGAQNVSLLLLNNGLQNTGPTTDTSHAALYTNLLTVNGNFKSLSQINTAPILTVLSTDILTEMKPSFISEKCKFWVKNTVMYCSQEPLTKICAPVITIFNYFNLCHFTFL